MKFILNLVILFGCMTFSFGESEISPELDKFMELKKIPDELFDNNAYIAWLGLNYPGDDWMTINKKIYRHNEAILNEEMQNGKLVTSFVFNLEQKTPHAPKNHDDSLKLLTDQNTNNNLLYLTSLLKDGEYLYSFKQYATGDKQYLDTQDFFPCKEYLDKDCLQEMEENRIYIEKILRINSSILKRFQSLVRDSEYTHRVIYNDMSASTNIIYSSSTTQLFQLNLSDALMDFLNDKPEDGLEKLVIARKSIDLLYEDKSLATVIHFVFCISFTQFLDQTMNVLFDSGRLDNYLDDPRVGWIVRPYPENIGLKLNESIIINMMEVFKSVAYPYIKVLTTAPADRFLSDEEEYIVLMYLHDRAIRLPPAVRSVVEHLRTQQIPETWQYARQLSTLRNQVFNRTSIDMQSFSEIITVNDNVTLPRFELDKLYVEFFQNIDMKPREALAYLNVKYSSNVFFNDYYSFLQKLLEKNKENIHLTKPVIDKVLSAYNFPISARLIPYTEFEQYWLRIYEQQNYHQLVYLKYLIMKDKIPASEIQTFLASVGNLAKNTITGLPYKYDDKTKILSTPFPKNSRYLPINMKSTYLDNKAARSFQVTIQYN